MKKLFLLFVCFIANMWVMAGNVTTEQAELIAKQFLSKRYPSVGKPAMKMAKRQPLALNVAADATAYYVFNVGTENGYVIVSGSDLSPQVLAYSSQGTFNQQTVPANMRTWLDGYADQIAWLEKTGGQHEAPRLQVPRKAVSPLLTSQWGQGEPYNNMCPIDPTTGSRCVTGCVATALAQVINYYKYPARTIANIPSYTTETKSISMATIGITDIDWDNMLESYSESATTAQKNAVAQLMLLCGQATEMDYNISANGGSGAVMGMDAKALQTYFGYDKTVRALERNAFSTDSWESLIYDEVAAGRPVLYGGQSTGGGHAFVVDGYDGEGLFHINWGWDGDSDSYFLLSVLNPYNNTAIGSSSSDDGFSFGQDAVVGIQHGSDDIASERFTLLSISNTGNTTYTRSSSAEDFTGLSFKIEGYNMTTASRNFMLNLALIDAEENILETITTDVNKGTLDYLYGGTTTFSNCSFGEDLADGEYYIVPVSKTENSTEWEPCWRANFYRIKATINGNTLTLAEPSISLNADIQAPENANVMETLYLTAQITNNGSNFNDYVYLAVDGYIIGGRMLEVQAGKTADFDIDFMTTSTGSHVLLLAYKGDSGYTPFAIGTVTVTGDLSCSINVTNATDGVVQDEKVQVTLNIENIAGDYDDDVLLRLFQYDESADSYNYVSRQMNHLTLSSGESASMDFEFEGLENSGKYLLSFMYRKSGEWVTDVSTTFTVRILEDGDLFTARTAEGVNVIYKVLSAANKTCQAGVGDDYITATIVGANTSGSGNTTPYNTYWKYSTVQMLYTPEEIGMSGKINGIAFYVMNAASCATSEMKIYLGHKSDVFSGTSDYVTSSNLTLVYSGTPTLGQSTGWEVMTFNQNSFTYNGRDNLVVVITKKCSSYVSDLKYAYFSGNGYVLTRGNDNTTGYGDITNTSAYSTSTLRPTAGLIVNLLPDAIASTTQGNVTIPDIADGYTVVAIGAKAFQNRTSLTEVTIPRSVNKIGDYAFGGCTGLTRVTSRIRSPFTIASTVFDGVYSNATLNVPYGSKAKYENTNSWNQFSSIKESEPEDGDIFTAPTIENVEMTFRVASVSEKTCEVLGGSASTVVDIVGSESGTTNILPYSNYYRYSTTQMLYTPSEIGYAGSISSIAFKVAAATSLTTTEVKIYLGHKSGLFSGTSDYVRSSDLTLVYSGNPKLGQAVGWETLEFNQGEFAYNGTDNLVVVVTKKSSGYSKDLTYSSFSSTDVTALYRRNDDTENYADVANTSNAYNTSSVRPCIQIGIEASTTAIPQDTQYEVTIPQTAKGFTVTGIGSYAFCDCNGITEVYIPRSVKAIGDNAFDGCNNLATVSVDIPTPLPIVPATFSNRANAILRVPVGQTDTYRDAEVWKDFWQIVEIAPLEITLTDGQDYENARERNVNILHYSRTFKNTNWQAWYAPFDVTLTDEVLTQFSFAKFAGTYTEEDGSFYITVVRMKEGDVVKGNTPYVVQAKVADKENQQVITLTDATLKAAEVNSFYVLSAEKKITFRGNYSRKTVTEADENWYVLSGGQYSRQLPGNTIAPFRCFFTIEDREDNPYATTPHPASVKLMVLDDGATSIEDIEEGKLKMENEADTVYDLSGRQVNKQNLRKGIYIINGKKVFVK